MKLDSQVTDPGVNCQSSGGLPGFAAPDREPQVSVALLTGGIDRPYVFGLTQELVSKGAALDVIGSDSLDCPEYHHTPRLNFLNLRGDQRPNVGVMTKALRILKYYTRLIRYAVTARPKIFHILWNNKIELFDRTLLTLYYKSLGKTIVLTAHNVNAGRRDSNDTFLNRLSLRIQYHLADHIFVHTQKAKLELREEFGVPEGSVTVIPFGINNSVAKTCLAPREAKQRLGILSAKKTILFYGRITPYKGLDYLITAFQQISARRDDFQLIIAGRPENDRDQYWTAITERIRGDVKSGRILMRAEHIPDSETETYFKAADLLVLPYTSVYQSGVLYLGYSFGLPILATDVGTLKEDIIEEKTGFVVRSQDPIELANGIERYFASDLYSDLSERRQQIIDFAAKRHSWDLVGDMTMDIYSGLLQSTAPSEPSSAHR